MKKNLNPPLKQFWSRDSKVTHTPPYFCQSVRPFVSKFCLRALFSRLSPSRHLTLLHFSQSNFLFFLVMADTNLANRIWCSKCGVFRDSESFETNKSGRTKKLCNRHGKKRDLEVLYNDWDNFEAEIHSWNHPRVFNMDSLPVGFASQLPIQQDGSTDRSPLNNAINMLAKVIWRKGGFRFWHRRMKPENLTYVYFCSQDADRVPPSVATGRRNAQRMERFSCQSYLAFQPSLEDRTLAITLRHSYHSPYMDRKLNAT
ncbi:hypothetical protein V1505DRAFT_53740 [Lipomyces doorenjongii]